MNGMQAMVRREVTASAKGNDQADEGGDDLFDGGEPFEAPGDDDSSVPNLPVVPAGRTWPFHSRPHVLHWEIGVAIHRHCTLFDLGMGSLSLSFSLSHQRQEGFIVWCTCIACFCNAQCDVGFGCFCSLPSVFRAKRLQPAQPTSLCLYKHS